MALPSGYKQLEYIESTGTQYIDTEYFPRWNTRIVDEIKMAAYSGTKAAFGTRNANSATASKSFAVFQTGANTFRVDYFGSSKTITLDVSTDQKLTIDMNKNVCAIGGKTVTNTAVTSGEATYTLMLFTYNSSGKAGSLSSMRRCSTKVYEGDVLVRHYIPCETSSGEVGLWEDVEGVFRGNDGEGTFVAGPEFIIGSDRFPINYRRLSFVESTGTQYIDTGFKPNQDTRVVAQVRCIVGTSANYIFGARYALSQQNYSFFASKNGHYAFIYNTKQVDFDKSANTDEPFVIDFNKNVATIGNNSVSGTYATFAAPVNLILFGVNSPDKIIYGSSRIYSCKIYDNGTLVRDFIPCETDGGEIGFWDTVELRFYGNAGSGSFIDPLAPSDGHNTNIGGVAREIEYGTVLIGGVSREFKKGTVRIGGVLRDLVLKTEIFTITTTGKLGGYCKVTADGTSLTAGKTYEVEEDTQITVVVTSDYTANTLPGKIYLNGTLLDSRNYTFPVTSNVTIEGLENYTTAAGGGYWGRANITTE